VPKLTKSKSNKKQPPPDRQEALSGSQVVDIHSKDRGSTASWILIINGNGSSQFRIASGKSPRRRLLPQKKPGLASKMRRVFRLELLFHLLRCLKDLLPRISNNARNDGKFKKFQKK